MLTKALAVGAVVALTATMGPGVASTTSNASTSNSERQVRATSDTQRAGVLVRDRQRRDPTYVRPAFNADWMRVYPRLDRGWFYVQVHGPHLLPSDDFNGAAVFLQTRGDRRPDYRIVRLFRGDGDGDSDMYIARIHGWDDNGVRVDCPRLGIQWKVNDRLVEFDIPRRCINRSGDVRVNAETWDLYRYRQGEPTRVRRDGVPRYRTLTRWI